MNDFAKYHYFFSKTFATITKSQDSKSLSKIISESVVIESKRLLKFTVSQINKVAFRLGFDDPFYFIKFFKSHEGRTPMMVYRNVFSQ